jgi:hypothetical protein
VILPAIVVAVFFLNPTSMINPSASNVEIINEPVGLNERGFVIPPIKIFED